MPRRHPSGREPPRPIDTGLLSGIAPRWAQVEGYSVRVVQGEKEYRCPGCHQVIRPGSPHLVVVPDQEPGHRRHWHTPCWRRELGRGGPA